ncbi:hypothetical protein [Aquilutibacter rugosus]|jgi:hypothetical protein|uniref:hypothetical protein n=1 Tax=Aquilutibacter rugosus TaxID=3115820 RepID=UPI002F427862
MKANRIYVVAAAAVLATAAMVGCKKKEETAPVAPVTAPAATVSVTSVDLGNAIGADSKVSATGTTFKPTDKVYASVSTSTSDMAATVPGTLGAKWYFGTTEIPNTAKESQINFNGTGNTAFDLSNATGMPAGKYKVDISLNGAVVSSKEFEVK